ncbi:hypothetical protein HRW18_37130 [Streptomyces lunaelactis]|uniref:hypothetical protein n=1 Tax=Streptomyces lunaelactis TaxID=1535768 RepID=UPI001585ACCE|nr:hypothetical protein [Streptomyces lunaelactis]NUK13466.1 hypothetical protein [Streptomyces lunaelactis]NUL13321.1 hypothetical protein [Streptomyces lunaelactis]NUL26171.1 hypothetical protein [Streptomyces lunaelactis]
MVADNTMNRERGLAGVNSYARKLGFDPIRHLVAQSAARPGLMSAAERAVPCGRQLQGCPTHLC